MNDAAYELNANSHPIDDNPARNVRPLGDDLPSSLTEAIALLEESRIQCIELKIMLDAAENFVAGADDRDRQAQAALSEMRSALASERSANEALAAQLEEARRSDNQVGEEADELRQECERLRSQSAHDASERDRLRAELQAQQALLEQVRQASNGDNEASSELLIQLETERTAADQLRAELAEERAAYDELSQRYDEERNSWLQERYEGDSDSTEELKRQVAELQASLRETSEQHELAIAAQLREIQRSNEAERSALARLKGLEQELSIIQARAAMLAARSEPDPQHRGGDEKSGGLMSRFVGRLRGRKAEDGSDGEPTAG